MPLLCVGMLIPAFFTGLGVTELLCSTLSNEVHVVTIKVMPFVGNYDDCGSVFSCKTLAYVLQYHGMCAGSICVTKVFLL